VDGVLLRDRTQGIAQGRGEVLGARISFRHDCQIDVARKRILVARYAAEQPDCQ
jgi:hypothetical protein